MRIRSKNQKAILSILFASGIVNSQLPAASENSASTDSAIQQLATNPQMKPEVRAYYLLRLASCYLTDTPKRVVEGQFTNVRSNDWTFSTSEKWVKLLTAFEETSRTQSIEAKNDDYRTLADVAIQKAMNELGKSSDAVPKLHMYLIASNLCQKIGNKEGELKCKKILEATIEASERNASTDEDQLIAVSSILTSMANNIIPVRIPDLDPKKNPWAQEPRVKQFTEKEFAESEKLKRRSVALADRLSPDSHERRKAHRDFALWYSALRKPQLAEKEKQILFKLVGSNDDDVLYARPAGCGHVTWWQKPKQVGIMGCGMG
ncbi:MAG TPA: hypothetical protein EYN91_27440 [Candidatus Melainabacteria bacterium]|nr:hypothetical protein [Candidatus Melainabacteria bacterium]HIN67190.1 hypothetical protein [Candidatus Obscuribacterales bacterium]